MCPKAGSTHDGILHSMISLVLQFPAIKWTHKNQIKLKEQGFVMEYLRSNAITYKQSVEEFNSKGLENL